MLKDNLEKIKCVKTRQSYIKIIQDVLLFSLWWEQQNLPVVQDLPVVSRKEKEYFYIFMNLYHEIHNKSQKQDFVVRHLCLWGLFMR